MLKYASHLTSAIASMASLIECTNVAAQEAGSSRAKNVPSFHYVQSKTGDDRSATENEADRLRRDAVREKTARGGGASDASSQQRDGDVASLLDALAQLRRTHETENRRVAETAARRKAEEKPLLAAWINVERKAEEVSRILAGANAEVQAKLSAKANATLKAEETRILAAWADLRRKADLESRSAAEAAAKRKAQEAHLLAALARAKLKNTSDRQNTAGAKTKLTTEKQPLRAMDEAAKRAAIPRSSESARERNVRADPPTGAAGVVPAPVPASRPPEQVELINRSLSRGRKFIKLGRINEGRLFLERAADAGSAEGAFELAESYDPTALQELGVVGVVSDKVLAAKWYRRAGELGANGTIERTNRLSAR